MSFEENIEKFKAAGNRVIGKPENVKGVCTISFNGSGSTLILEPGVSLISATFTFRNDNCKIQIGKRCRISGNLTTAEGSSIVIGAGTLMNNRSAFLLAREGVNITIGKGCLFAGIQFRTSDGHSIYDSESGDRLNLAQPIWVEDRVWIAEEALILKGVTIKSDAVIAARSVVTKDVPEGRIVAGNPARVVKQNICWDRKLLPLKPNGSTSTRRKVSRIDPLKRILKKGLKRS